MLWTRLWEERGLQNQGKMMSPQGGRHSKSLWDSLSGFKKALLQNPREVIQGRILGPKVRVTQAKTSELQTTSQSCSRGDPGPPESEPNRPEKEPERLLGASAEIPLKAILPPKR